MLALLLWDQKFTIAPTGLCHISPAGTCHVISKTYSGLHGNKSIKVEPNDIYSLACCLWLSFLPATMVIMGRRSVS